MKLKRNKNIIFIILFGICLCSLVSISAKYIQQSSTEENSVKAKAFYFESDLLDGNSHSVTAFDDGKASITFHLMNYADDQRISAVDIDYNVAVTGDENTADVNINNNNSKLLKDTKQANEVTVSNLEAGKTYTVTATTNNTYSKTLSATIDVNKIDTGLYANIKDQSDYIEVTVYTKDAGKTGINLNYCEGLIPDNTDELMKDALLSTSQDPKSINFDLEENNSHVFRLFKSDTTKRDYEVKVNENGVSVNEKTSS